MAHKLCHVSDMFRLYTVTSPYIGMFFLIIILRTKMPFKYIRTSRQPSFRTSWKLCPKMYCFHSQHQLKHVFFVRCFPSFYPYIYIHIRMICFYCLLLYCWFHLCKLHDPLGWLSSPVIVVSSALSNRPMT